MNDTHRDGEPEEAAAASCPICASTHTPTYKEVGTYHFRRCEACAFVYLDPMPTEMTLESIYNNDGAITPDYYPKAGSRYRRALATAFHLYRFARGRSVLDVGCGGGFQVGAFRFFRVEASGLDISADSIAYAQARFRSARFYCEEFSKFEKRNLKFGFIYSSEVIEHVPIVSEYMKFLNNIIDNDGFIYITTPDLGSPRVPANVLDWDVFNPPRHVQFFQESNLVDLFAQHGFAFVKRFADPKTGLRVLFRKT